MNIRPILLLAVCFGTMTGCSTSREPSSTAAATSEPSSTEQIANDAPPSRFGGATKADSLFFSIERTPCFGTCKAYRIEVYRSGSALYNGRSNMEKQGPHTALISTETMAAVLAHAEAAGFFAMQDTYDADVTDVPSTTIRIIADGKDKKVMGRVGQPAAFKALVVQIEELLLPVPWKPVRSEP